MLPAFRLFDGNGQNDSSGDYVRNCAGVYSFYGIVFYCGYPGRRKGHAGRKSDSESASKRKRLALCCGIVGCPYAVHFVYDLALSEGDAGKGFGGTVMRKKRFSFSLLYSVILLIFMYLPIVVVVVYSFNSSRNSTVWGGVTLDWYKKMAGNRGLLEALKNSLILAVLSSFAAGIIGTLGAVGMARIDWKSKGAVEYISTLPIMIPEIILGMVFMAFLLHLACLSAW